MTWTIFTDNHGQNETEDDAPGRGGYSTVLVPVDRDTAVDWWQEEYERDPTRMEMPYPESTVEEAWTVEEVDTSEAAREACGEMTLDKGGIGAPAKRLYTWDELHGRLDVRVVDEEEL